MNIDLQENKLKHIYMVYVVVIIIKYIMNTDMFPKGLLLQSVYTIDDVLHISFINVFLLNGKCYQNLFKFLQNLWQNNFRLFIW